MSFLGQCNVKTVLPPGFQGLSCSKVQGFEGGLFQKIFKGYIFCFLGHLFGGQLFELFARETNLKKQSSVRKQQVLNDVKLETIGALKTLKICYALRQDHHVKFRKKLLSISSQKIVCSGNFQNNHRHYLTRYQLCFKNHDGYTDWHMRAQMFAIFR